MLLIIEKRKNINWYSLINPITGTDFCGGKTKEICESKVPKILSILTKDVQEWIINTRLPMKYKIKQLFGIIYKVRLT